MFTFSLAFFADHRQFSLHFQPLSAFRYLPKEEEGIWMKASTMKTTDHGYYMCQTLSVKLIALLTLQHTFHFF